MTIRSRLTGAEKRIRRPDVGPKPILVAIGQDDPLARGRPPGIYEPEGLRIMAPGETLPPESIIAFLGPGQRLEDL
jgi:hypothetical protein